MSPKPVRPARTKALTREPSPFEQRLAADRTPVAPPEVRVRFDGGAPSAKALKAMGVEDPRLAKLAAYLGDAAPKLIEQLASDRDLAELFTRDPAKALPALGVPKELVEAIDVEARAELFAHFRGVNLEAKVLPRPGQWGAADAATTSAMQLLADTIAGAAGSPAAQDGLRSNPQPQVVAAATAHPPAGVSAGSAAAASLVSQVTDALLGAAGTDPRGVFRLDPAALEAVTTVRIPTPRGL